MSSSPQETFTNPPTYSPEETVRGIEQAINQFWAESMAAQDPSAYLLPNDQSSMFPNSGNGEDQKEESSSTDQTISEPEMDDSAVGGFPSTIPRISNDQTNGTMKPEGPVTEAPTPTAPSATPDVKPIPQARARGVKRAREPKPSPRTAKRPADGSGQPATKRVKPEESHEAEYKPRVYKTILPNIPIPSYQRVPRFDMSIQEIFQRANDPTWLAAHPEASATLDKLLASLNPDQDLQRAPIGMKFWSSPTSSRNGNGPWSSPILPRQQRANGMTIGSSPPRPMSSPAQYSVGPPSRAGMTNQNSMPIMKQNSMPMINQNDVPMMNQNGMPIMKQSGMPIIEQNGNPTRNQNFTGALPTYFSGSF